MALGIGFIGLGGIARTHLETVSQIPDADILAVYDIDEWAVEQAAEHWQATPVSDLDALVSHPGLDAVFVCVPPDQHGAAERAVAEAGLALFVEKPVAIETAQALELAAILESNNIITQVGHHWRYAPGIEYGRELLRDRTIGYLDGRWWGAIPGDGDHWWRDESRSGGQIIEQAIHIFDAIRYLSGEIESVCAYGGNRLIEDLDFPDLSTASMHHRDGTVSHVSATSAAVESRIGIEVVAENATLSLSESSVVGTIDGDPIDERSAIDPYEREVLAFLDAVRTGSREPIRSPYDDSVQSLAVTEAVTESVRRGEAVSVSEFLADSL